MHAHADGAAVGRVRAARPPLRTSSQLDSARHDCTAHAERWQALVAMPSTGIPAAATAAAVAPGGRTDAEAPVHSDALEGGAEWAAGCPRLKQAVAWLGRARARASGAGRTCGHDSALCRWRVQVAAQATRLHELSSSCRLGIGAGLFVMHSCTALNSDQAASSPPQPPAARAGFVRRYAVVTGAVHSGRTVDTPARHLGRSHKPGSGRCRLAAAAAGLHAPWPSPPALS